MRTKVLNNKTNKATISKTRIMAQAAMLAAVAIVLMLFEFPLPFLAPPFYEMDFSEVPVLIGTFAIGRLRRDDRSVEDYFEFDY